MKRKQESLELFINNDLSAEEWVNMIVTLEEKIEAAIGFTDYEWDSQWKQLSVIKETLEQ